MWSESHSVMPDSLQPHGLYSPWNSPGQDTDVGSLSLLQGIFPTQESNHGLLHCRWILNQLSYQGSPLTRILVYYKRIQITNSQTEEVHSARCGERAQSFYALWNLQISTCSPGRKPSEPHPSWAFREASLQRHEDRCSLVIKPKAGRGKGLWLTGLWSHGLLHWHPDCIRRCGTGVTSLT